MLYQEDGDFAGARKELENAGMWFEIASDGIDDAALKMQVYCIHVYTQQVCPHTILYVWMESYIYIYVSTYVCVCVCVCVCV
jgi:hypothetical protein